MVMKRVVKNQLAYWFPMYVWAVLIFYFSSIPLTGPIVSNRGIFLIASDYYKHVLGYGFLTFLLWRAFHNSKFRYSEIFAVVAATIYGISTELHQYFIPGRTFSLFDIFFNFIGCVLIQPLIVLYKKFIKK